MKLKDILITESAQHFEFTGSPMRVSLNSDFSKNSAGKTKPMRMIILNEEDGEQIDSVIWSSSLADPLKAELNSKKMFQFTGKISSYNGKTQFSIMNILGTNLESKIKTVRAATAEAESGIERIKSEINKLVQMNIHDQIIKTIIEKEIIKNERFFIWPAATNIHHNYPGGLALHSLNVAKNALSMWEIYAGENMSKEILIAGALLHDIGKLEEYTADGGRTLIGDLKGHPFIGAEKISSDFRELGVDPDTDERAVFLIHILLSHHGKLEFGSPVAPGILEAIIVSLCDNTDAGIEGAEAILSTLERGRKSDSPAMVYGSRIYKWRN